MKSLDLAKRLFIALTPDMEFDEFALIVAQAFVDQRKAEQGIQPEERRTVH